MLPVESGNQFPIAELERLLDRTQWAVYHVQRIDKQLNEKNGKPYVNADRKSAFLN
ncbi:MAG: hypothetical protein HC780_18650 [Leptolyngbyaceae cyanobacterium CSU_1_3]|nr:hypothetical protein [Leptolyngbyaceae cyanobacterium CSU_1_3]